MRDDEWRQADGGGEIVEISRRIIVVYEMRPKEGNETLHRTTTVARSPPLLARYKISFPFSRQEGASALLRPFVHAGSGKGGVQKKNYNLP